MALGNGRIKAIGSKAGSIFCPERNHLPRQNCCQYHCYRYHLAVLRAAEEKHGDQVPRSPILINVCAVNFSRSWMLNCGTLPALLSVFYSKCFCCLCLCFLSSHLALILVVSARVSRCLCLRFSSHVFVSVIIFFLLVPYIIFTFVLFSFGMPAIIQFAAISLKRRFWIK